jgi:hypothetical protein
MKCSNAQLHQLSVILPNIWLDHVILFDTLLVDVKLDATSGQETHAAMCNVQMLATLAK